MSFGICTLSVIPCRAEGNDRAEIVTQLLFGEYYTVLEEQEKWVKIKIAFDNYEAWICRKQFTEITSQEFEELNLNEFDLVGEYFGEITNSKKEKQVIPLGSTLPYLHNNELKIRTNSYNYKGKITTKDFY